MPYFSEARERAKMEKWMQNWTCQRTLGQMKFGKLVSMGNIVQLFVVVFSSRASFSIIFCFQETVAVAMCLAAALKLYHSDCQGRPNAWRLCGDFGWFAPGMCCIEAAGCTLAHRVTLLCCGSFFFAVGVSGCEVGLEAENTELQALVKEWRMWYAQCILVRFVVIYMYCNY